MENKILVVGESCRDIFVYCDATRLCPDIPVPVLKTVRQTENYGMAKNVQTNIQQIIQECDIITNDNFLNITKTRYMHDQTNHMFIRVDTDHNVERIDLNNYKHIFNYEIIVISDYNKGFLEELDIEYICNNHPCVFLDTKKILGKWAEKAKFIKINNYEYENSKLHLTNKLIDIIIHTKGGDGCYFQNKQFPVKKVEVKDSSGAGDSFMAALVCKFYQTKSIEESIIFANSCAEKVVQQRGVTLIHT